MYRNKPKKPPITKSQKAGLVFPVARFNRLAKSEAGTKRVGGSAPIYLTAVTEYIVEEIIELAGECTKKANRKRITPEDISNVLRSDSELSKLYRGLQMTTGDKLTNTSKALAPRGKK